MLLWRPQARDPGEGATHRRCRRTGQIACREGGSGPGELNEITPVAVAGSD